MRTTLEYNAIALFAVTSSSLYFKNLLAHICTFFVCTGIYILRRASQKKKKIIIMIKMQRRRSDSSLSIFPELDTLRSCIFIVILNNYKLFNRKRQQEDLNLPFEHSIIPTVLTTKHHF